MPIYEYKCLKCNTINTFLKKSSRKGLFSFLLLSLQNKNSCVNCGSKKLEKIISSFSVSAKQSYSDMLNDVSKMGPVNFVPDQRMPGPPPGGCPYGAKQDNNTSP